LKVVEDLEQIGKKHGATAGQVTLAWILAQSDNIIPIPGTRSLDVRLSLVSAFVSDVADQGFLCLFMQRLNENLGALNLTLSTEELKGVRETAEKSNLSEVARYPPGFIETLCVDTPPLSL
jgi:aryl-alcohol dehydrogenase-like predicted oxidoreductase